MLMLNINDRIVEKPQASDVESALDAGPFPEDWTITLEDGEDTLDAVAQTDGSFTISYWKEAVRRNGHADVAAVKAAFVKYLQGDKRWRKAIRWEQAETASDNPAIGQNGAPITGRNSSNPPTWAIVAMVVVIALIWLLATWPDLAYAVFPFAHSSWFWPSLIFLPMVALVLIAAASKGLGLARARSWKTTTGRVITSKIAQRRIKFPGEGARIENFAAVTYEYKLPDGQTVRGSRIGIGDDNRGADAAPTVKRYPAGAVVTVYFDPNDPKNCVLERGGPKGLESKGCAIALVELAVAGGVIWAWITKGPGVVKHLFPHAAENLVVLTSGLGVFAAMMAYAQWRMSQTARKWPTVAGKVVRSEVQEERDNFSDVRTTSYRPMVEYVYEVGGHEYRCAQIELNVAKSGTKAWADRVTGKYATGSTVIVRHDPENPSNAVLENPGSIPWPLLALAAGAFVFALWQTHVLG